MKILFFLKSRITEAMREYFVLCFQKDSGQRLSPKHLEARRHRLVLLGKHITLSHGHCMNAVLHERMPALRLLCAICNGNRTHSQCVSPGKKKTPSQPVHGRNQHCTDVGRKGVQVMGGLRVGSSKSCVAHLSYMMI